ncbi:MAG: exo-beta-N-acetylmuramidase NamZ domain-containing protein [Ignavibacteriales bacterium]
MPLAQSADFSRLRKKQLAPIAEIVQDAIHTDKIPGAVILIGSHNRIIYRRAFGYREIEPKKLPMTADTIFDLASLTKVVATTTAIMQLAEAGKLSVEDEVAKYWPEFKTNGKEHITIRQLLTHYSGLRPDLGSDWSGYDVALRMIAAEKPVFPPGTHFVYSDINFEILGELVRRISGQTLDVYCAEHIFKPLGMKDTGFRPSPALIRRIAPTEYLHGKMLIGEVHDPTAYDMGGVAGHAGLFSTASDLSIFAQMLLNGGSIKGVRILSPATVERMTTPQSPPHMVPLRGFGWDIGSPFASNRDELLPAGSYSHTGFTGTGIWIDPVSRTYIIILTNQVHPYGKGNARPLRSQIISLIAEKLGSILEEQVLANRPSLTEYYRQMKGFQAREESNGKLQTGIDVLVAENFAPLSGLRIGLITNHSGIDSSGQSTLELLHNAPGVKLAAIFSPEHGLTGKEDDMVSSSMEPTTGLPLYSLYSYIRRPTETMLDGLDALIFDIQDIGVRFYTYITTMGYAMEAAAKRGIPFYVLDRPNPINDSVVQGPVMDGDFKSFTGYFPLPVRYGMTVGELAEMFNAENNIGAELHVIRMHNYKRTYWYDETGLQWVNPSPSLHSLTEAILYSGVGLVEGANVSVGRGTDIPFELLGAPWINARELAVYLNSRRIRGVQFIPVNFTPDYSPFRSQLCHGVRIILLDRNALDSPALGIEIAGALYRLYPNSFQIDKILDLMGSHRLLEAIKDGRDPNSIALQWQVQIEQFRKLRSKYLLY